MIEAILVTIINILVLVLFKGSPKNPPSYIAQVKREKFTIAIKDLFKNKVYRKIWIAYGMIVGSI